MRAYDKAKADPAITHPCEYVKSLKLPGWYRCCEFAWKKARKRDQWGLLCDACPKLAKVYKEPPNLLRSILGKKLKFMHRGYCSGVTSMMPEDFEKAIAECVAPQRKHSRIVSLLRGMECYIHIYIYTHVFLMLQL